MAAGAGPVAPGSGPAGRGCRSRVRRRPGVRRGRREPRRCRWRRPHRRAGTRRAAGSAAADPGTPDGGGANSSWVPSPARCPECGTAQQYSRSTAAGQPSGSGGRDVHVLQDSEGVGDEDGRRVGADDALLVLAGAQREGSCCSNQGEFALAAGSCPRGRGEFDVGLAAPVDGAPAVLHTMAVPAEAARTEWSPCGDGLADEAVRARAGRGVPRHVPGLRAGRGGASSAGPVRGRAHAVDVRGRPLARADPALPGGGPETAPRGGRNRRRPERPGLRTAPVGRDGAGSGRAGRGWPGVPHLAAWTKVRRVYNYVDQRRHGPFSGMRHSPGLPAELAHNRRYAARKNPWSRMDTHAMGASCR